MSPQDQADAVRLGLLRAQRLAVELTGRGIPASAITVRGDAFGTGAKVVTPP
jgi:outer membrane protein OmpA-like peptidoglycan-associated protein